MAENQTKKKSTAKNETVEKEEVVASKEAEPAAKKTASKASSSTKKSTTSTKSKTQTPKKTEKKAEEVASPAKEETSVVEEAKAEVKEEPVPEENRAPRPSDLEPNYWYEKNAKTVYVVKKTVVKKVDKSPEEKKKMYKLASIIAGASAALALILILSLCIPRCSSNNNGGNTGTTPTSGSKDTGKSSVYVEKIPVPTNIPNGKISLNKQAAYVGETVTVTLTPDEGYQVKSLKVNGVEVEVDQNNQADITVTEDMSIEVEFELRDNPVNIDSSSIKNGKVTADKATAKEGQFVNLAVEPDPGYELDTLTVNGQAVAVADGKAQVEMTKDGLDVEATFKLKELPISIDSASIKNGSVSVVGGTATARMGDEVTLQIAPDTDYQVKSVTIDGQKYDVDANGHVTFTVGSEAPVIDVQFESKDFPIAVDPEQAIENGSVGVAGGKTTAKIGETVTLSVTPDEGYKVSSLIVNGVERKDDIKADGTIDVEMTNQGISYSAQFESKDLPITISSTITNGTVTVVGNKTTAKMGETVTIQVTPDDNHFIGDVYVNGEKVTVDENGQANVIMTAKGISVEATFTTTMEVSTLDEKTLAKIANMDDVTIVLTGDITLDTLPTSKGSITFDLNGHTLITTTGSLVKSENTDEWSNKSITIKNGTIKDTSTSGSESIIDATYAKGLTLEGVTISNDNEYNGESSAIVASSKGTTTIKKCDIDFKGDYGVSTGGDASTKVAISIDSSDIKTTSNDSDNAAVVIDNGTYDVSINGSILTGDRQALVGRDGTYTLTDSTFKVTGAYVDASDANKTKDNEYKSTADSWGDGNDVVSAAVVLGDESSTHTTGVTATMTGCTLTSTSSTKDASIHSDSTTTTAVTMDAVAYTKSYSSINKDTDATTTLTVKNYETKTVSEVDAMTTSDNTKLYQVKGVVTAGPDSDGYFTFKDVDNDKTIKAKIYNSNAYTYDKDGNYVFDASKSALCDNSLVGFEMTIVGQVSADSSSSTIENAVIIGNKRSTTKAAVTNSVASSKGTVSLSVDGDVTTDVRVGDQVEVNVEPVRGYAVDKVTVTKASGETSDITDTLTFTASTSDTISATFYGYLEFYGSEYGDIGNDGVTVENQTRTVAGFTFLLAATNAATSKIHKIYNGVIYLMDVAAYDKSGNLVVWQDCLTITSSVGAITKIEFDVVGTNEEYYEGGGKPNAVIAQYGNWGSYSYNASTTIGTWTGSSSVVKMSTNGSGTNGIIAGIRSMKIWYNSTK